MAAVGQERGKIFGIGGIGRGGGEANGVKTQFMGLVTNDILKRFGHALAIGLRL